MSAHKTITANGLEFAYYEQGEGPLVLCLHGFPDTADTWLAVMPVLAEAGYRVIAPFMRGYHPTQIPANNSYTSAELGQDVLALIEALGEEQAILIGHDWGALAAYTAANLQPERISKLVTVAIPHPRALKFTLRGLWKARHFITFRQRGSTLNRLQKDSFAFIDAIYKRWSPNWDFTQEDLAPIKQSLSHPGVPEAILGYYWSFRQPTGDETADRAATRKTSVPTLSFFGDADGALDLSYISNTPDAFTGPYEYIIVADAGHFLHREEPQQFIDAVLKFLQNS